MANTKGLLLILIIFCPLVFALSLGGELALPWALFITIVVLWLTETIPLQVTALLVPALACLYGIVSPKEAYAPFGNQVLFLFIGAFILAKAMAKHGLDKRIACFALTRNVVTNPTHLINVIALVCWALSMWISNTAACAIMTPICIGIIDIMSADGVCSEERKNFSRRILLVCAFASSIGGIATPVGSPPNILAIEFLSAKEIEVGFLSWMLYGLPVSIVMLILLSTLLRYRYPLSKSDLSAVKKFFNDEREKLGKLKKQELQVMACFILAVALWLLPGVVLWLNLNHSNLSAIKNALSMGTVAIVAALPLFVLTFKENGLSKPNLEWSEACSIDWGTIILFGGGLCLGSILDSSGLAANLGLAVLKLNIESYLLFGLLITLFAILLSEFGSNTASAVIIVPVVISLHEITPNFPLLQIVVATAFGASFGFMLPVSTPPNAIIFGTGKIELQEMIRSGLIFDVLGLFCITTLTLVILPALGF